MQRRHYEFVAAAILDAGTMNASGCRTSPDYQEGYKQAVSDMACEFAIRFEDDNPKFDRDKFYKACGVAP